MSHRTTSHNLALDSGFSSLPPVTGLRWSFVIELIEKPGFIVAQTARREFDEMKLKLPQVDRDLEQTDATLATHEALAKAPFLCPTEAVQIRNVSEPCLVDLPPGAKSEKNADKLEIIYVHVLLHEGRGKAIPSDLLQLITPPKFLDQVQSYRETDYRSIFAQFGIYMASVS